MNQSFEIVDAYTHCGLSAFQPETPRPINANQPIEVLRQTLDSAGVRRAVLVQHTGGSNEYIEAIVKAESERFAGVCIVDNTSPNVMRELERLAESGNFRGVRWRHLPMVGESPDLMSAAVRLGFIIMTGGQSVKQERALIEAFPECRIVLTHLGHPKFENEGPTFPSHQRVLELAEHPGVYMQISGMDLYTHYPYEEIYPLIEMAVEAFGVSRLMWASDYPVLGDVTAYKKDLQLLLDGHLPIPADGIPQIAGANAGRLYFGDAPEG